MGDNDHQKVESDLSAFSLGLLRVGMSFDPLPLLPDPTAEEQAQERGWEYGHIHVQCCSDIIQ